MLALQLLALCAAGDICTGSIGRAAGVRVLPAFSFVLPAQAAARHRGVARKSRNIPFICQMEPRSDNVRNIRDLISSFEDIPVGTQSISESCSDGSSTMARIGLNDGPGLRVFGLEPDEGQLFSRGALITLSARSASVLRKRGCRIGTGFRLCNNHDGEW